MSTIFPGALPCIKQKRTLAAPLSILCVTLGLLSSLDSIAALTAYTSLPFKERDYNDKFQAKSPFSLLLLLLIFFDLFSD